MNDEPLIDSECLLFEERVQELLDQRISPLSDCKVAQHAVRCPECTHLLQSFWVLSQSYDSRTSSTGAAETKTLTTNSQTTLRSISAVNRIAWSFGPTFAALLFVGVAIFFSNRPGLDHELANRIDLNRQYQMVQNSNSSDPGQEIGRFFSTSVVPDVKGYSISLYRMAHATRDWTNASVKMPQQMFDGISKPLTPIHSYVPYSQEVSIIVQLRHYFGVAWKLLQLSMDNLNEQELEDLGWQPIPLDWNVA